MSRLYDTEEALNLILSDEADSDGELAEPVCPGSDEDFDIMIKNYLLSTKGISVYRYNNTNVK